VPVRTGRGGEHPAREYAWSVKYGVFAIAVVALVQPWLIAVWRRYFRQGQIDVHETGLIELGFSALGPTIGLHGTLRAVHRDIFVADISLNIVRLRDGAQHTFGWAAFRGGQLGEELYTLPASFLVSASQPHRYNIVWSDNETRQEMDEALAPVKEAWQKKVFENWAPEIEDYSGPYEELAETPVHVQAFTDVGRRCYWDAGSYRLDLAVASARPDRSFRRRWKFELTEQDAELLLRNSIVILRQTCGFSDLTLNFANAAYLEVEPEE